MVDRCVFNSSELKDIQYISSFSFNRDEIVRFDSRVGVWVGYTELGVRGAERWNKNTAFLARVRARVDFYCKTNIKADYSAALDKRGEMMSLHYYI